MKKILTLILSITLIVSIVSCSNTQTENIALTTASMFGDGDSSSEHYNNVIQSFEKQYDITIHDDSEISSESWKRSIRTSFQLGSDIDVLFYFSGSEVEPLLESNSLVDIETIQDVYPEYGSNISDSVMSSMTERNGLTYAIPIRGFWEGLFVNTDLFEQYNLELPTTWENFIIAIETFSNAGIKPISVSFTEEPHYWIDHIILSYGGTLEHNKILTTGTKAPDSWIGAFDLTSKLYQINAFGDDALTISSADTRNEFVNKESAMIVEGSWFTNNIVDQNNTIVMPFPSYKNPTLESNDVIGGYSSGFYITKNAWDDPQKQKLAVRFVEQMTSDESIQEFAIGGGIPASNIDIKDEITPIQTKGVDMIYSADDIIMPIDYRLNALSWEYIINHTPSIIENPTSTETILNNAANLN